MKKIILTALIAITATGSLVADASAMEKTTGNVQNAGTSSQANHTNQHISGSVNASGLSSGDLEPIPGSIIYGGQPMTRLMKAPVGSSITHDFFSGGNQYVETYVIQPDHSLKLTNRTQRMDD